MKYSGVILLIISGTIFLMFPHVYAQSISLGQELSLQYLETKSVFKNYLANPQMPAPVGISSYGLYHTANGTTIPYSIVTDKIMAKTTINSLQANVVQPQPNTPAYQSYVHMQSPNSVCATGPSYPISKDDMDNGANLQFNVMMLVKTSSGLQKIWLQDTARFNTLAMTVNTPHNIVANLTSRNSENLAYGNGFPAKSVGSNGYYEYEGACYKYSLPLTITYEIDVQTPSNNLVQVIFKNNGKVFDTVYLPIVNVESAHIVVTPYELTDGGIPVDAELVWVGYCCSQESSFTQMDSTLSMYYEGKDGKMHTFPSLFTFGTETAETSANLLVETDPHGGHVIIGENNNAFLEDFKRKTSSDSNSIIASTVVPEFGPMVSMVSILAIISMLMISKIKLSSRV